MRKVKVLITIILSLFLFVSCGKTNDSGTIKTINDQTTEHQTTELELSREEAILIDYIKKSFVFTYDPVVKRTVSTKVTYETLLTDNCEDVSWNVVKYGDEWKVEVNGYHTDIDIGTIWSDAQITLVFSGENIGGVYSTKELGVLINGEKELSDDEISLLLDDLLSKVNFGESDEYNSNQTLNVVSGVQSETTKAPVLTGRKCTQIDCLNNDITISETYYDINGNITNKKYYPDYEKAGSSVVYDVEEYSYDTFNRIEFSKKTDSRYDYSATSEYQYDSDGNLIKRIDTDRDGNQIYYEWHYDSNGLVQKHTLANIEGVYAYENYIYDDNGRMISEYHYDNGYYSRDELLSYKEYEYDEKGNLVRCTNYDAEGSLNDYVEYFYDDNVLTKAISYNYKGEVSITQEYDLNGNVVRRTNRKSLVEYVYDSDNYLLEQKNYWDAEMETYYKYIWEDCFD